MRTLEAKRLGEQGWELAIAERSLEKHCSETPLPLLNKQTKTQSVVQALDSTATEDQAVGPRLPRQSSDTHALS